MSANNSRCIVQIIQLVRRSARYLDGLLSDVVKYVSIIFVYDDSGHIDGAVGRALGGKIALVEFDTSLARTGR
ncbi:hypothetical protein ABIF16_001492 [Bradyrhizobium elkanii]